MENFTFWRNVQVQSNIIKLKCGYIKQPITIKLLTKYEVVLIKNIVEKCDGNICLMNGNVID